MFQWVCKVGVFVWGHPLSVDGNLFKIEEILTMSKIAIYTAPSNFEQSLQWFSAVFDFRSGVWCDHSVAVNIPLNKVQTENDNFSGNVRQEALLKFWQKDYEIDVEKYYGINNISAHLELNLYLVKREGAKL